MLLQVAADLLTYTKWKFRNNTYLSEVHDLIIIINRRQEFQYALRRMHDILFGRNVRYIYNFTSKLKCRIVGTGY